MTRKILLLCGVLASIAYVATDLLSAMFYGRYHNFTSQAISELMASRAPSERLADFINVLAFGPLKVAFGIGVWMSPGRRRLMRLTGSMIVASALLGLTIPTLFEMNVRGSGGDPRADQLHILVTVVMWLVIITFMGTAAFVRGPLFRWYSFASIAVMLLFGALAGITGWPMLLGQQTPWMGLLERISVGAHLLWVVVFAIALARAATVQTGSPGQAQQRPLAQHGRHQLEHVRSVPPHHRHPSVSDLGDGDDVQFAHVGTDGRLNWNTHNF
jgi:Protein of unknown function (DUF998)